MRDGRAGQSYTYCTYTLCTFRTVLQDIVIAAAALRACSLISALVSLSRWMSGHQLAQSTQVRSTRLCVHLDFLCPLSGIAFWRGGWGWGSLARTVIASTPSRQFPNSQPNCWQTRRVWRCPATLSARPRIRSALVSRMAGPGGFLFRLGDRMEQGSRPRLGELS
jgi:hypothetical protein